MKKLLLVSVLALAFLLRTIGLVNRPAGFTPDEASFGYDAYSIIKTGRDQWGNTLPLSFKSFGDYKLPVYTYLAIPSVFIFGLNEFAVRLPNAVIGTAAVAAVYFLVQEASKSKDKPLNSNNQPLIASILLTISPWHLSLSRGAFEANLTTFFLTIGIYFFFKAKRNSSYYILSALAFGVNMFTYHTARLLTPLIAIALFILYKKSLNRLNSAKSIALVVFIVFAVIASVNYVTGGGSRINSSSIFALASEGNIQRYQLTKAGVPDQVSRILSNKVTFTVKKFIYNYLSYFSPQFLWTQGPMEATYGMIPGIGVLYLFELPFLMVWIINLRKNTLFDKFLLFWLIVSPIPAALSVGPGLAANRAAFMMPAIQIASATGAVILLNKIIKQKNKIGIKIELIGYTVLMLFAVILYLNSYYFRQPIIGAKEMIYGMKEVFGEEIKDREIVVSKSISEPQIYYAFYQHLDPAIYQQYSNRWPSMQVAGINWVDQLPQYDLPHAIFHSLEKTDLVRSNTIVVGKPEEFTDQLLRKDVIYYPNHEEAYYLMHTK